MVDEVSPPVVERPMARELLVGVDGHLVEAGDDDVVALGRLVRVDVGLGARDPVRDAVSERVRERVRDSLALDVDRMHVLGAVQRELDRQQSRAAADVEAPLPGADLLLPHVLPDEKAA